MQGAVASLNVSVAAGVLLFELNRQIKVRSLRRRDA
jgi:tRNA G18 (ribose-2'-O)-methylase SpoU